MDASPSQEYPPVLNLPVPIYRPGWGEALSLSQEQDVTTLASTQTWRDNH